MKLIKIHYFAFLTFVMVMVAGGLIDNEGLCHLMQDDHPNLSPFGHVVHPKTINVRRRVNSVRLNTMRENLLSSLQPSDEEAAATSAATSPVFFEEFDDDHILSPNGEFTAFKWTSNERLSFGLSLATLPADLMEQVDQLYVVILPSSSNEKSSSSMLHLAESAFSLCRVRSRFHLKTSLEHVHDGERQWFLYHLKSMRLAFREYMTLSLESSQPIDKDLDVEVAILPYYPFSIIASKTREVDGDWFIDIALNSDPTPVESLVLESFFLVAQSFRMGQVMGDRFIEPISGDLLSMNGVHTIRLPMELAASSVTYYFTLDPNIF